MPVNTPGYSAQEALSDYSSECKNYTSKGFVYVHAGCRGRDEGAPAGVTDLKAAIRYLRYTKSTIAGDTESIFTFGHSGGGAQSAILGASGNSELYNAYLEEIGAVMDQSDAIKGAMCWCPITNLDIADAAYEWNMGLSRSGLSSGLSSEDTYVSKQLAKAYASYINKLGLKDSNGNTLKLSSTSDGYYQSGSYYKYMMKVVETSLNTFLKNTTFPYSASQNGGMPGGPGGNGSDSSSSSGTTYKSAQAYIDSLNRNGTWIKYDKSTNTAKITSLEAFVKNMKSASKSLGAFDQLDSDQTENPLFGGHFDSYLKAIEAGTEYEDAFTSDFEKTDSAGNTVETRVNMYNPMYYISSYYDGYNSSDVAKYWRIRSGIEQGDTSLCTETNLALCLKNYGVNVDFATVWGQGHTEAEVSGDATSNVISWVNECMK